jgi:hypothetical protein
MPISDNNRQVIDSGFERKLKLEGKIMARPITVTPVLTGKDAERFAKKVKENEKPESKISDEEYNKAIKNYNLIKSIACPNC